MRVSLALCLALMAASAWTQETTRFTDVTDEWGIEFVHNNGAFGQKYLPETMGGGVAVFDADNDFDLDILFINSRDWPGHRTQRSETPVFYEQVAGEWVDRTVEAGFDTPMYGLGVAVADYDNDGDFDVYITCLNEDKLFRNDGDGAFTDVTRESGIRNEAFSGSAAWLDYDNDGWLDLYVCNYVQWSVELDLFCTLDGVNKSYCTPESYNGVSDRLFRNNGNGTFADATERAGLLDPTSKSLGVVAFDYNNDRHTDIFVSNDTEPDKLYENQGDGTFEEIGMLAGVAFGEMGVARAGMGVDAADYDRSGRYSVVVGNFSNEMISLWRNEGNGLFIDAAAQTKLGTASFLTLAFGAFFFDANADGWLDLFVTNGHVENEINRVQQQVTYAQAPHLFLNHERGGRFLDIADEAGFQEKLVGRGAAYGDLDGDGDLDLIVAANGGPARVYRNDTPTTNNVLRIGLAGATSNRHGIGATVIVSTPDGEQRQTVRGGGSYCSQSEYTLTFGLGNADRASVDVLFPSGRRQRLAAVEANQWVEIGENGGFTRALSLSR